MESTTKSKKKDHYRQKKVKRRVYKCVYLRSYFIGSFWCWSQSEIITLAMLYVCVCLFFKKEENKSKE